MIVREVTRNGIMISGTEEQYELYDKRQELKDKFNVVFGECFALEFIQGRMLTLMNIYIEDDGVLHHKLTVNGGFINDLERVVAEFKEMMIQRSQTPFRGNED